MINEFNEIANNLRSLRPGTDMSMNFANDDRGNGSSLSQYTKGHFIGI